MSNAQTEHSKKLRIATSMKWQKEQLAKGTYRQIKLQGKSTDLDIIDAAIKHAGGSRVQALVKICQDYLNQKQT